MAKSKRTRGTGAKRKASEPGTPGANDKARGFYRASTEPDLAERGGRPRAPIVVNAFGRTPEEAKANFERMVASVPDIIEKLARMPCDPSAPFMPSALVGPLAAAGSKHLLGRVAAAVKQKYREKRVDPQDLRACFEAQLQKDRDADRVELDRRAAIDYAKQVGHDLGPDPDRPRWPRGASPGSVKRARTKKQS